MQAAELACTYHSPHMHGLSLLAKQICMPRALWCSAVSSPVTWTGTQRNCVTSAMAAGDALSETQQRTHRARVVEGFEAFVMFRQHRPAAHRAERLRLRTLAQPAKRQRQPQKHLGQHGHAHCRGEGSVCKGVGGPYRFNLSSHDPGHGHTSHELHSSDIVGPARDGVHASEHAVKQAVSTAQRGGRTIVVLALHEEPFKLRGAVQGARGAGGDCCLDQPAKRIQAQATSQLLAPARSRGHTRQLTRHSGSPELCASTRTLACVPLRWPPRHLDRAAGDARVR